MNNYCEYTVLRVLEVRSAFRFPIKREETNQTDGIKKKSGDLLESIYAKNDTKFFFFLRKHSIQDENRPWNGKDNTLNASCRKYVETI